MTKTAFITGSARRLGACTARYLHNKGFNLVLHCHRSAEDAQLLCSQLNAERKNSAYMLQADLNDAAMLTELAEQALSAFDGLDLLINNASAFYPTPVGLITLDDWHNLFASNALAPLLLSQACYPVLKSRQGCIINMVDIHADRPIRDHTVYCMAKAALVTMTRSLALEMAPEVRVNAVAPGAILWPETGEKSDKKQQILSRIPARKMGDAEDVASAIYYLSTAHYVTGQILTVDGGRSVLSE